MSKEKNPWIVSTIILSVLLLVIAGLFWYRYNNEHTTFEIVDDLGGNISVSYTHLTLPTT